MSKRTNKEWGHIIGGWLGLVLGFYLALIMNGNPTIPLVGNTIVQINPVVILLIRICLPIAFGGWLSNWFSNFGSFIDAQTDNKTVFDLIGQISFYKNQTIKSAENGQ